MIPWKNNLKDYIGAPQDRNRRRKLLLTSGQENDMPQNAPYPGESMEEFLARINGGAPAPVDPRAAALAQMIGDPASNPANTAMMGRTTENFYDQPSGVGSTPVEEMMTNDPSFGGDASYAEAFGGGYDAYAGGNYPPTRMQLRNRRVMHPEMSEDEHEQSEMQENYHRNVDETMEGEYPEPESRLGSRSSTEDELDMVQQQINRDTEQEEGFERAAAESDDGLTGDEDGDKNYILSLEEDGEDPAGVEELKAAFEARYGYYPEL